MFCLNLLSGLYSGKLKLNIVRALLLLLIVSLAGCGSLKQQSFNRQVNSEIKLIQVLPMPQANVRLFIFNNVANNFGIVGVLIGEANRNSKETHLQSMVSAAQFNQFELFQTEFSREMELRGFKLLWSTPLTEKQNASKRDQWMLRKRYVAVNNADAQLDLGVTFVGYAAAGNGKSNPYRPTVNMGVRLVSANGKTVLMQDELLHHNVTNSKTAVIIEPDSAFSYSKFSDLKTADSAAIDGLQAAVVKSAKALAEQFGAVK
jgi:hypothetical protein